MTKIKTFWPAMPDFESEVNEDIAQEEKAGWHVCSTHAIPHRQMTDEGEEIVYKLLVVFKKDEP